MAREMMMKEGKTTTTGPGKEGGREDIHKTPGHICRSFISTTSADPEGQAPKGRKGMRGKEGGKGLSRLALRENNSYTPPAFTMERPGEKVMEERKQGMAQGGKRTTINNILSSKFTTVCR